MKKFLLFALGLSVTFTLGCSCAKKDQDDNNDKNNNSNVNQTQIKDENVIGEKNIDGLLFENTTFEIISDVTMIVTKVTNTLSNDFYLENYQLIVTDESGNVLTTLTSTVEENFASGESKSISTPISIDLSNAKNVNYLVNVKVAE